MKKYICIVLIVVLIVGLFCFAKKPNTINPSDKTIGPTESLQAPSTTNQDVEPGEQASQESPAETNETSRSMEELYFPPENTITESYSTLQEYADKLAELGFTELYFGTDYCKPESITYNDQAFRLEFSYFDDNHNKEDKWTLYGVKTDAKQNITKYSDEYLLAQEIAFSFDFLEGRASESVRRMSICPQITEIQSQNSLTNPSFAVYLYSAYYPTSQTLYNCYRENATIDYSYVPGILKTWNDVLSEYFVEQQHPEFSFCVHKIINPETKELIPMFSENTTLSNIYCIFEPGMTLKDWVDSPYNFEGWTWFTKDAVSGMISPQDRPEVYVVLAEYHEDGSLYTIDEYMSNTDAPGVPLMTHDDFLCIIN